MSLEIKVEQKPKYKDIIKIKGTDDVYKLKEVEEIKSAVQEYMLFIGLDRANYIRGIDIIGIGKSNCVYIDVKDVIRKAINTTSSKVILVHNHPSNSLKPSMHDEEITIKVSKILKAFDIQLVDHIIVNDHQYASVFKGIDINEVEENIQTLILNEAMLIQENLELKRTIQRLEDELDRRYNNEEEEY